MAKIVSNWTNLSLIFLFGNKTVLEMEQNRKSGEQAECLKHPACKGRNRSIESQTFYESD